MARKIINPDKYKAKKVRTPKKTVDIIKPKSIKSIAKGTKKAVKRMTDSRKKALNRARGILKRAEQAGYIPSGARIILTDLSTQKLKALTRKKLIREHGYVYDEKEDMLKQRRLKKKELEKHLKPKKTKKIEPGKFNRNDVQHERISKTSTAEIKLDAIKRMILKGVNYRGEFAKKGTSLGFTQVQGSAQILDDIFSEAERRFTPEQIIERLEEEFISINNLADMIEHLILAVYDSVYARWANGRGLYSEALEKIASALDVDTTFIY